MNGRTIDHRLTPTVEIVTQRPRQFRQRINDGQGRHLASYGASFAGNVAEPTIAIGCVP